MKTHVEEIKKLTTTHFVAYCKFCREGFSGENELFQHRKAHERCPYENCKFNANGKVIAEHIQRVHIQRGNALVKIQDLTTPEQIEKWREERRKRYPTTSNVLLRQQAQEERFQRGEKLQEQKQRFGDNQQRNHIRNMDNRQPHGSDNNNSKRKRPHNNRERPPRPGKERSQEVSSDVPVKVPRIETKPAEIQKPQAPSKIQLPSKPQQVQNDDSSDEEMIIPRFKGTSQMRDYHKVETIVKEQAALSILGMYGSDTESDNEEKLVEEVLPKVEEVVKPVEEFLETMEIEENNDNDKQEKNDEEAPEEVPIEHTTNVPEPGTSMSEEKSGRKWKREGQHPTKRDAKMMKPRTVLDYSKLRKPSVNPFLEKLLQDDIRHERNLLLQCVNYVVKNNFFGVGQTVKAPEQEAESKQDVTEVTTQEVVENTTHDDNVEINENL